VYDPTDPVGRLLFNVLAMVAEFDLIRLSTREGMKVAKAKGRLRAEQPKLNHSPEAHLVALLKCGDYSTAELGDLFGVARFTVYRAVERERAPMSSASASAEGFFALSRRHPLRGQQRPPGVDDLRTPLDVPWVLAVIDTLISSGVATTARTQGTVNGGGCTS
jgi:hypothetical protein